MNKFYFVFWISWTHLQKRPFADVPFLGNVGIVIFFFFFFFFWISWTHFQKQPFADVPHFPFYLFVILRKHFIFWTEVFVNSLFSKVQCILSRFGSAIQGLSCLYWKYLKLIDRKFIELLWNNYWSSQFVNISQAMMYYYQLAFFLWSIFWKFYIMKFVL